MHKSFKKAVTVFLTAAMIMSTAAAGTACLSVSAASSMAYSYKQLTGSSAVINCSSKVQYASVDKPSIATAEVNGGTVTVTGVSGAVGIVEVTISNGYGITKIEVPIGYTTFSFNGSSLTVFEGSDTKYEVIGISSDGTEYTVEPTTDSDGNSVYSNTDQYSLNININKKGGTYAFTGKGSDMSISVKKEATGDAVLLLSELELTSSLTSPLTIKKNSTASVEVTSLEGHKNTLTDSEFNNADTYGDTADGGDGTNAAFAESAVIKGKAYSDLTLNGKGTLNLVCNTKNAVKSGEYSKLTIEDVDLNVTSAKNGISADNSLTINSGDIDVTAEADAIRTDPDSVDADAGCAADIVINGGDITLKSGSDGIQSAQDITINGGTFDITAGSGYNDSSFDSDTMSCKGIKASYNSDSTDSTDTSESTNTITINAGSFTINTADDAVHSDGYAVINGGDFDILTGDDGMHADTSLTIGKENAADCCVHIDIAQSYEGLESGNVYIYSGSYNIVASDDGINAAGGNGGSTEGFNPGGGPGGPGGQGGPGGGGFGGNSGGGSQQGGGQTSSGDYSLNIYGGKVNVNCEGDGLDSNGALNLTGGNVVVWSAPANSDNAPLDADGTITVNGATVFGAGSSQMAETPSSSSQGYVTYKTSVQKGKTINVKNNSTTVFNATAPKNVNYVIYSAPGVSSSTYSITADSSALISSDSNYDEHSFGSGTVTKQATCTQDGVITYTCSDCGAEKTEFISATGHTPSDAVSEKGSDGAQYSVVYCSDCGDEISRTKTAEAVSKLQNTSYLNSEIAQIGDDIRITGGAEGGTGPYTYAFYFKRSTNSKWNKMGTEFGSAKYAVLVPKAAASYDLKAVVKDSTGATSEKIYHATVYESLPLTNIATINTGTSVSVNKTITIAGRTVGGTKPCTFEFYFKRSVNSKWNKLSYGNDKQTYAKFTPTSAASYDLKCVATDADGTVSVKTYTITAS